MTLPGFLGTFGDYPDFWESPVAPMLRWWFQCVFDGCGALVVSRSQALRRAVPRTPQEGHLTESFSGSSGTTRHWATVGGKNGVGWGRMGLARLVWISVRVKSGTYGWGLKDDLGVTTPVTSRVGTVSSLFYWGYTPFTKRVEPLSGLSHKVASSRLSRKVSFSQRPHGASPSPLVKTEAVSTSWDGLVKLWDYRTQRLLCSFDEHVPSPVTALAFAPVDGRFFVTTGGDAKLALFARR